MRVINRFKSYFENLRNVKLNRVEMGEDKYGNKMYQYYSNYGLPYRREINYNNTFNFNEHRDLAFWDWHYDRTKDYPTIKESRI